MANKEHDDTEREIVFRNPDTVQRRAWIERALAGVRRRLDPDAGSDTGNPRPESASPPRPSGTPRLYVVTGGRPR
jgi:hypothetical protein